MNMRDFFSFSSLKYRFGRLIPLVIFTAASAYFLWNLRNGDFGQESYRQEMIAEKQAEEALQKAKQEENTWQKRVDGLGPNALDKDLLDERSRKMLNDSAPDEIIIPLKPGTKTSGDNEENYSEE